MKIQRIRIKNFRHIDDLEITIHDMVALIGPNNVGKSSVLKAICYFCEPVNSIPDIDFNAQKDFPDVEMEIKFSELTLDAIEQYSSRLIGGNQLIIKKSWSKGCRKPTFFSKELKISDRILSDIEGNWRTLKDDEVWQERAQSEGIEYRLKDQVIEFVKKYVSAHQEDFQREEAWIPNPSGLQEILNHHMPEVVFVEGVRDATSDISDRKDSTISKILGLVIRDALVKDETAKCIERDINRLLSRISQNPVEDTERLDCVIELESMLARHMPAGMDRVNFLIDASEVTLDEIVKRAAKIRIDDEGETPIENQGHGLQRAVIFSLLRTYSEIKRKSSENVGNINDGVDHEHERPYLFLVEEPELFLHPQAQRMMAYSLRDLSTEGNQVIFSTHSPNLIDLSHAEQVCILSKSSEGFVRRMQIEDTLFEEDERSTFKLLEFMNPHRSELFFAKKVIFVEGQSDRIVLEMIAEKLGVNDPNITIIETESKDNIPLYVRLAEKFNLNYAVMHDIDAKAEDVVNPPVESDYECAECFDRRKRKHDSDKGKPLRNLEIQFLVQNGKVFTWYPDINAECSIPKGKSKPMSAHNWCKDVNSGKIEIPDKLERYVTELFTIGEQT